MNLLREESLLILDWLKLILSSPTNRDKKLKTYNKMKAKTMNPKNNFLTFMRILADA